MNHQFDVLPCGYVAFDDAGTIVSVNETLVSWIGFSKDELAGANIEKIFTVSTRIFHNTHFFPLIKLQSKVNEVFLTLKGKDGTDLPVLANAIRNTDTSPFTIHCVFMLVEERKKFEQELLNARRDAEDALTQNKRLVELTGSLQEYSVELDKQYRSQKKITENLLQFSKIISHDLQEPIRKIQIFADMIMRDTGGADQKNKNLATKIQSAAERLKALTAGLQEYIEVDAERLYRTVDLNEVVNLAAQKASRAHGYSDFDLQTDQMPNIEGYAAQIELLFFHLIDNAMKFRDPDKRLILKVESLVLEENIFRFTHERYKYVPHVRIRFCDNGPGIRNEYRNYVFQLLRKVDHTTTGIGLGLPLVKKIVDNHAGEIKIDSGIGSGTCFEIVLPLTMTQAPSAPVQT